MASRHSGLSISASRFPPLDHGPHGADAISPRTPLTINGDTAATSA